MRTILFFILLCIIPHLATAQEETKYWIFLTDKLDASGKNTQVEEGYLADKAIARRALRGESQFAARFALQDAPISYVYETDLQEMGVTIEHRSRWLNAVTARLSEDGAAHIAALPYVREIRPVAHLAPDRQPYIPVSPVIPERISSNCPSSVYGQSCTQLDIVNAIPPLERGINGTGVILGFIDTHFSDGGPGPFSHRSLRPIIDDGRLIEFRDFTNRDSSQPCRSEHSHGMEVASIAVGYHEGQLIGPGHGATIYAAATECAPYERNIEEDNFVAAVEWMESEGVDVITASLGYFDFDGGQRNYIKSDLDGDTGLTTIAMDAAASRGVVPLNSAGNEGPGRQTLSTPADGDSVIAVGGICPEDIFFSFVCSPLRDHFIAGFSSRGPTADDRIKPDVSAQGFRVSHAQRTERYSQGGGTSFSAPMVAGIVTQILQVNPSLGPKDVWQVLTSTASQSSTPDNDYGWGVVNADAAIMSAMAVNRSVEEIPAPRRLIVHTPYPNPFQGIVHFTIEATEPVSHARLMVMDVLGREVGTVYQGPIRAGSISVPFRGTHLPPGVYAYTLQFDGEMQSGLLSRVGF